MALLPLKRQTGDLASILPDISVIIPPATTVQYAPGFRFRKPGVTGLKITG
jgi:hypothetical protein